jgi:UMF1 family MFS transporter
VTVSDLTTPAPGAVAAWGLWDWAFSAFNAVATTFVFSTYLSDSAVVALCLLGTVFVRNTPACLWLGLACLAVGTVFYELASVFYNSLLPLVSTPRTVGKVSAFGWSMGYFGGIVLLVVILVLFVQGGTHGHAGLLHVTKSGGLYVRLAMLVATLWAVCFSIPVFLKVKVPPPPAEVAAARTGFLASYGVLFRNIRGIWRASPNTIWFLLASAIFRDGLTGVFTFGGVIGHVAFGLSTTRVLYFGIAANVIAGIATVSAGRLDYRLGPKPVSVASLAGMIACGVLLFAARAQGTRRDLDLPGAVLARDRALARHDDGRQDIVGHPRHRRRAAGRPRVAAAGQAGAGPARARGRRGLTRPCPRVRP